MQTLKSLPHSMTVWKLIQKKILEMEQIIEIA